MTITGGSRADLSPPTLWAVILRPNLFYAACQAPLAPALALTTSEWSAKSLFTGALNPASYLSSLMAFAVAIMAGQLFVGIFVLSLNHVLLDGHEGAPTTSETLTPALVGTLERIAYIYALMFGFPEFIPIWIAAKTVSQWRVWQERRVVFNTFLMGTGLSLAFSILAAAIIAGNPI